MRVRITVPLVLLVGVVVTVLLVPGLDSISDRRTAQLTLDRTAAVDRIGELARVALEDDEMLPLRRHVERFHEVFGEEVLVTDAAGQVVVSTGGLGPDSPEVVRRLRDFGANAAELALPTVRPWSSDRAVVSAPVEVQPGLSGGVVVLAVDLTAARADVRRGWLFALVPAALLLAALVLAAQWAARWILRPVRELDEATNALAGGRPPTEVLPAGPPELRRLSRSFDGMARTLSATLDQQRELVAGTSHQLRNPLAAVRLHMDLLAQQAELPPAALDPVQRDLDRLDATLDRLLVVAEAEHRVTQRRAESVLGGEGGARGTSVGALAGMVAERWSSLEGASVETSGDPTLVVEASPLDLGEMVDTVVENAVKYGGPGVSVRVHCAVDPDDAGRVVVRVDDDGEGLDDDELRSAGNRFWRAPRHESLPGTGLGLALVAALAEANDGTMGLGRSARGGLEVRMHLPRVTP